MEKHRRKTSQESRVEQGVRASRELGEGGVMVIRMVRMVVSLPGGGYGVVDLPARHQGTFVLLQWGHWLAILLQQQCALCALCAFVLRQKQYFVAQYITQYQYSCSNVEERNLRAT